MGLRQGYVNFLMWMGQPSKEFALPEDRLASEENSEVQSEGCAKPTTGRMAQNPTTAPTHHTLSDGKLRKSHGPDWIGVQVPDWKIPSTQRSEDKGGILWVLRSASSSETICATAYFCMTEKSLGRASSGANWLPRESQGTELLKIDKGHVIIVSQTWLKYVLKDIHASFSLGFLLRQLWHGSWRARWNFHQEITMMEQRYQEKSTSMLADCCWTLARNAPEQLHKQQTSKVASSSGLLQLHVCCTCFLNM